MAIRVKCPNPKCGKEFNLKAELAGKTVRCDACKQPFQVPSPLGPQRSQALSVVSSGAAPQARSPTGAATQAESPTGAPATGPVIGQRLGHYLVQEKLGEGGMAIVYKGRDLRLDKTVALKVMSPAVMAQGREFAERFLREARAAAKVEHSNVLPVHFIGVEGERLFIAMQYVDGGTLEDKLVQSKRLAPKEAGRIVREIALALQAAHEQNIIHRDIKPSNIMLTKDGRVLVADFGLAKSGQAATKLTASGMAMGTPGYMSPEQCLGQPVDARSDLYSLGVTFYELVTGALPYQGDSPVAIATQHLAAPVPDPRIVAPDVDQYTATTIMRLMAKLPSERYQTAAELVQDLSGLLGLSGTAGLVGVMPQPLVRRSLGEGGPGVPSPVQAPPSTGYRGRVLKRAKRRSALVPVVLGLLAVAAVAALGYFSLLPRWRAVQKPPEATGTAAPRPIPIAKREGSGFGVQGSGTAETAKPALSKAEGTPSTPRVEEGEKEKESAESAKSAEKLSAVPSSPAPRPSSQSYDDVYVTTAATNEKIPHPLSRRTYKITYEGKAIEVPEGMVYVPAGTFTMGENESEHKVYLDAYFIGKYEVTNAEWKAFVDATGFTAPWYWTGGTIPGGKENHPVVDVSWQDAQEYCEWVSGGTGRKATLPTEAQWEKAARGPKGYIFPWGNTWDKSLCNSGWLLHSQFDFHSKDELRDFDRATTAWSATKEGKEINAAGGNTTAVGSFPKGICFYGCYDMAGNVSEWCSDWYVTDYYRLKGANRNPEGPSEEQAQEYECYGKKEKGKLRVVRGGCWSNYSTTCRATFRYTFSGAFPSNRVNQYGFRLVVALAPSASEAERPPATTPKAGGGAQETAGTTRPALSAAEGTPSTPRTEEQREKAEAPRPPAEGAKGEAAQAPPATGREVPLTTPRDMTGKPGEFCKQSSFIPYRPPKGTFPAAMDWSPDGSTALFCIVAILDHGKTLYHGNTLFGINVRTGEISDWPLQKVSWPTYSPDGRTLAVASSEGSGSILLLDVALRQQRACIPEAAWSPAFTPDGNRICFITRRKSGHPNIWTANIDGSNELQLTDVDWGMNCLSVSPAGDLFTHCSAMPNVIRVQRIGGDGAVLVKINLGESPRWSPSGQLISFYHAGEIWTMHRMGKSMLRITNERGHGTTFRHHAWSPDGTKMIYYIEEADRKGFKIVYLDLVGIGKKLGITCSPSGSNAAAPPSAPGPSTPPAAGKGATANYDGVYVATAVTGEKIPHPLSKKTYPFHYGGRTIQVPEGMVFVSGGPFIMGDDNQPKASPAHEVDVEAFFIGKYEVTNAEYMEFVNTTGYPMPKYFAENGNGIPKGRENHPVTGVSWEDAERYCNWCGKRLPTEREWEKAASWDPVKRRTNKYVWGDKWDEDPAHPMFNWAAKWGFGGTQDYWKWRRSFEQSKQGRTLLDMGGPTTAVGSFRKDRSASRCYDMAGNVDEWVADWFDKYPGNTRMSAPWESKCGQVARVTRGGCWASPQGINLQCAERGAWEPSKVDNAIGFRCATDCPWKPK